MKADPARRTSDFSLLYNNAACGLITFDLSGKIHEMNQTLRMWTGLENFQTGELIFPNLLEKGSQLYFQLFVYPLLKMHREVKEISLKVETGGESFQCLLNATVIAGSQRDDNALVHAAIFKVVDRKKFEDELRLRKNKAELETLEKDETLKKVASDQSHLVRAPLANMLGLIALLEQTNMTEDSKELLYMLKESANQLDTVIKNIVITANT
jgi:nitrogen-specific signal transduction histidine kinase